MEHFETGDVVRLRSAGPRMTVEQVLGTKVVCVWFPEYGPQEPSRGNFEIPMLTRVQDVRQEESDGRAG